MSNSKKFICKVLFICMLITATTCKLRLEQSAGDVLNIYYQDMLLFHMSPTEPIVEIGTGNTIYNETQGSFEIEDVVTERIPLDTYIKISNFPVTIATVTFASSQTETIVAEMILSCVDDENGDSELRMDINLDPTSDERFNRIWVSVAAESSERVFGAGEQYTYLNLRGHHFPIFTTEQGIGRDNGAIAIAANQDGGAGGDYYTTYWPQASYLAAKNNTKMDKYSLFLDNREYLVLNFTEATRHEIFCHSDHLSGTMFYSTSIGRLVSSISATFGRQPMLPDWAMKGAILGVQRGMDEVKMNYLKAKEAKVDIAALWIQDWSGQTETAFGHRVYWNWEWDPTYYPGLDAFIDELSAEGILVTVYVNPHLIEDSPIFNTSRDLKYLLMDSNGDAFIQDFGGFNGGTVDLLNVEAAIWYRDTLRKNIVEDLGCAGWMADFGEYTDINMVSNNLNFSGERLHNYLPVAWAETNKDIVATANTMNDLVFWMRAGGLGSSGYTALAWNGDQNVDFSFGDGLPSTIVATLSLALSGMGVSHFDIGGYTTQRLVLERSEELFLRSAEYSVFTPVMRTHEGNEPEYNVQFYTNQEIILAFARLTKIHSRLFNYTKEIVRQNAEEGIPVQRPMFYQFDSDDTAWDIQYQYMYGPDIIVAPALYKDTTTVEVYIPGGGNSSWIHFWGGLGASEFEFEGPQWVNITAPIGLPAVLYRNDSVWVELFMEIGDEFGAAHP